MHVMILGAGYSGKAIARHLKDQNIRISGTTRSQNKFPELEAAGIEPLLFDGQSISDELKDRLSTVTHLVQSISPISTDTSASDPFLQLIGSDLKSAIPNLEWLAYLSTVGVYGDHDGAWVDEDTLCRPQSARSIDRLKAESAWTMAALQASIPLSILRLSGIYGPGRNAFVNLEKGTAKRLIKKGQVFNRIRVEDIAGATAFLMHSGDTGVFNVTDSEPCPPQDVVSYAAQLMGVSPPPEQSFESATLTPMARSFYGENKRVSNEKLRGAGYDFKHPDYQKSLYQMWEQKAWKEA